MDIVNRLVKKTAVMNGECRVLKSERAGPKPIRVWVQPRKAA
jgi:hypothetical protein